METFCIVSGFFRQTEVEKDSIFICHADLRVVLK
jgi:hypothetical protein